MMALHSSLFIKGALFALIYLFFMGACSFKVERNDSGVYVKNNLPIARETILEDENEPDFFFAWLFYILQPSSFSCIVRHFRRLVLWLRLCHPI